VIISVVTLSSNKYHPLYHVSHTFKDRASIFVIMSCISEPLTLPANLH